MGFTHLLNTEASLANFRAVYDIPGDVEVAYCHEGDIALQRRPYVAFFPLMAILEGRVRFPADPLILNTLRFYGLCPNQFPPNFYWVLSCVSRLNQLYGLQLNHRDINFMYGLCGNIKSNYYLKVRDVWVRLILCLLNSNRNSVGEYVWLSDNCHANKLTCPIVRTQNFLIGLGLGLGSQFIYLVGYGFPTKGSFLPGILAALFNPREFLPFLL